MNSGYKDLDAVLAIDSTDKAESAVPNRSRAGGWKERWDVLVNKFIEEQEKTRRYIMNASDTKVGSMKWLSYVDTKSLLLTKALA
jgi:hypothetical protein